MLVEFGLVRAFGGALEIGKEVGRVCAFVVLAFLRGAQQVVDEHLGMDLFLDVEGRSVDDEITPVLLILPAPDELGIEVGVAGIADFFRVLLLLFQHGLKLRRRDVLPLGLVMLERFDGLLGCGFLGHDYLLPVADGTVAGAIILLNSLSTLALKSDSI